MLYTLMSDGFREQQFKNLKARAFIDFLCYLKLHYFLSSFIGDLFSSSIRQYHKKLLKVRNTLVRTFNVTLQPNQQKSSPHINIKIPFSVFFLNHTGDHIQVNIFHKIWILLF